MLQIALREIALYGMSAKNCHAPNLEGGRGEREGGRREGEREGKREDETKGEKQK